MLFNQLTNKISKIIEFPFLVLSMQIKQNECQSFKDNILLAKLRYNAPKCFDRDFEYPWVLKNINLEKGELLDIGSTVGEMLHELLPKEVKVTTLNINPQPKVKGVKQVLGDIRKTNLKQNSFDRITCISTLEHIGVEGRYGVKEDQEGDLKAMREMLRILKPGGKLLLTIPYGAEDVLPINKLYNTERMKKLVNGYKVEKAEYLKYNKKYGIWLTVPETEAVKTSWKHEKWYSIAFFILKK